MRRHVETNKGFMGNMAVVSGTYNKELVLERNAIVNQLQLIIILFNYLTENELPQEHDRLMFGFTN